jgi:hypothetical protein
LELKVNTPVLAYFPAAYESVRPECHGFQKTSNLGAAAATECPLNGLHHASGGVRSYRHAAPQKIVAALIGI